MALKIRLQRFGTRHAPNYRLIVTEARTRRDGRFVEILGYYNPLARGKTLAFKIDTERARYWMDVGAKPTDTARSLIKRANKSPGGEGAAEPVRVPVSKPAAAKKAPPPEKKEVKKVEAKTEAPDEPTPKEAKNDEA